MLKGKNIYVGVSGGVDSAVTCALLQEQGAQVTGVFIKGWYPPGMICTWAQDRRDAMRVCARLQIPFITLDASVEYKKGVIDYLIREYKAGRTPNPDIMCNKDVKFGAFYEFARAQGADYVATGHYAQNINGRLFRGVDEEKDQSYFLWSISKEVLTNVLFPVGGLPKSRVRALAQKFNLPVADKRDSQGICFLGTISVDEFLRAQIGTKPGKAVTEEGVMVGTHEGAILHTLGERVALPDGPWYVVRKDMELNELVVSRERKTKEPSKSITILDTNWFSEVPSNVIAQYRYHGPKVKGTFTDFVFTAENELPETIASGQSLVLYTDEECLGGGIIA